MTVTLTAHVTAVTNDCIQETRCCFHIQMLHFSNYRKTRVLAEVCCVSLETPGPLSALSNVGYKEKQELLGSREFSAVTHCGWDDDGWVCVLCAQG